MNEKILIVDDNRDNIRLFKQILTDQGFRVYVALNGASALSSLQEDPPDLILLDIMMPEMDGYTVCREIKKYPRLSGIPVLFLSAKNEMVDEMEGFACGAVDYITKPVSVPILLARIRTHLNLREARNLLERQNEELDRRVRERTAHLERALEEKQLLLGEVHHRVLNNLQFVGGLIILQMDRLQDSHLELLLSEYENRIHSMAMVHQELYRSEDFIQVDLVRYARELYRFHAKKKGLDDTCSPDPLPAEAKLNINFAIPCGMILNEFFSLCFRQSGPEIPPKVGFLLEHKPSERRYYLKLCNFPAGENSENPIPDDDFGLEVIRILVSQLRGEIYPGDCCPLSREIRFPDTPPITYSDVSALG